MIPNKGLVDEELARKTHMSISVSSPIQYWDPHKVYWEKNILVILEDLAPNPWANTQNIKDFAQFLQKGM